MNGSFAKDAIQLYYKEINGTERKISFSIRPPFLYKLNTNFAYSYLNSEEILRIANAGVTSFYLKLGNQTPHELTIVFNQDTSVDRLLIDGKEVQKEITDIRYYFTGNLFYLVRP